MSVFARTNSCKIYDLTSGCASHSPGCKSSNHKILRKLNFSELISYLLPTCQEKSMVEVSAKSTHR